MSGAQQDWKGSSLEDIFNGRDIWFTQHSDLSPQFNHAVLFHLPLTNEAQLPKPYRGGGTAWDQNNVRLPCSADSRFAEIDEDGNKKMKSRWSLIEESLLRPINTSFDLEAAIKSYNTRYTTDWDFTTLHELFEVHLSPQERVTSLEVMSKLIGLALQLPHLIESPIPLLKRGMNKSISLSQQQVACLLANAFLCTFPLRNTEKRNSEFASYPSINFNKLFAACGQKSIEKLKCLYNYFRRVVNDMPTGIVTFERRSILVPFKWEDSVVNLSSIRYHITSQGMIEDAQGMLQVDFANRYIGGGVIGSGCVQEEIRFVMNPEMIVARLFTESLEEDEALIITGCEQFNSYRGYSETFEWAGNFIDTTPMDLYRRRKCRVVAIDALKYKGFYEQFKQDTIKRELNKAYSGFYSDGDNDRSPIATGLWGCGAFNGYTIRSALIQLMASCVSQRNLVFYAFGDEKTAKEIADVYSFLMERNVSVGQLFKLMRRYRYDGKPRDPTQLIPFIKSELQREELMQNPVKQEEFTQHPPTLVLRPPSLLQRPSPLVPRPSQNSSDPWSQIKPRKMKEEVLTFSSTALPSTSRYHTSNEPKRKPSSHRVSSEESRSSSYEENLNRIASNFAQVKKPEPPKNETPKKSLIESLNDDFTSSFSKKNS